MVLKTHILRRFGFAACRKFFPYQLSILDQLQSFVNMRKDGQVGTRVGVTLNGASLDVVPGRADRFTGRRLLPGDPLNREINYLVDPLGAAGKSTLIKFLLWRYAKQVCFIPFGTALQMRTSLIKRGPFPMYVLDIPRTLAKSENLDEIYSLLESLKNGVLESSMYGDSNSSLIMNPPLIWVFSNSFPDTKKLSSDRWQVFTLGFNRQLCYMDSVQISTIK